jgi:hypothetical protein
VGRQLGEDTAVIVEHLPADQADEAITFVQQAAVQHPEGSAADCFTQRTCYHHTTGAEA